MIYAMDRDRISSVWCVLGICSLLICGSGTGVMASGVPFTAGFELPGYTSGLVLQNQSGWLWDGTGQSTSGNSSAIVQSAITQTGNQAVQVTKVSNSDRHWAVPTTNYPGPAITYPT